MTRTRSTKKQHPSELNDSKSIEIEEQIHNVIKDKGKRKRKQKKDPNAPKRPMNAFMFYVKDARDDIKTEANVTNVGDIGRIAGERWRKMNDRQKAVSIIYYNIICHSNVNQKYVHAAKKDRERYDRQLCVYKDSIIESSRDPLRNNSQVIADISRKDKLRMAGTNHATQQV